MYALHVCQVIQYQLVYHKALDVTNFIALQYIIPTTINRFTIQN